MPDAREPPTDALRPAANPAVPMPSPETVAAYIATDYFVHDAGRVRIRIGDGAQRHRDWLAAHRAASATVLTAWNPFGSVATPADNDRAQRQLLAAIEDAGLAWLPASGEDPRGQWEPEPGFCVFDATAARIDAWLTAFRQNAVVRVSADAPVALVWHPAIRAAGVPDPTPAGPA